ncbi:hypothetical protein J437_LFUL004615 [Ladona fulva]|uniref:Spermatogenesis-associated protein 7 n=1 Tax=Ladona fulva TaxID=123851 RepID=A0A8K0JZ88_LADFU|nr:hypothetical protein J437_LFUL004615 [Ladona fulva]
MRRYTTIKSNIYAPVSTNLFAQNMIHDHMVSHYRKTYFARSQVDSSPPWKYKTRDLYSERIRKKAPKFNPLADRKEETDTSSDVKSNPVTVCQHHFSSKHSSDHKNETIAQNQPIASDSSMKGTWSTKKIVRGDALPCDEIIGVPPLCISSKKHRQNPQHRNVNFQTKNKKCVCQDKRKVIYGKSKTAPPDNIKENLPKPHGKSRMQHPLHTHFENYQDNGVCISSGSEGNAGDDEDGTPTSSCDDFNQSARNSPLSIHNIAVAGADFSRICMCKHKFLLEKEKQNPCLCHVPIKGAKTAGSMASSRDSAYEGGGIMSSTENQRNSPDDFKGSKWYQPCINANYVEKEPADLKSSKEPVRFCSKSELYMKFLQDVTDDVLLQAVFTNEAMKSIFQKHIHKNVYNLDEEYMKLMINKLMEDLGVKPEACSETGQVSNIPDEKHLKSGKSCEEAVPGSSKVTPFAIGSSEMFKNKEIVSPRTKKELRSIEKKSNPLVNIERNVFMSKEEVMACLTDMGFEDILSEEIFQILAKQHSCADEVPTQSTVH